MILSISVDRFLSRWGLGLAMAMGLALPAGAQMAAAVPPGVDHPLAAAPDGVAPAVEDVIQPRPTGNTAPVPLVPVAHGHRFTVGFPQSWAITHAETDPYLTATAPAGEPAMTTEVSWYAEAPGQVVPTLLADIREKGYTMTRYDAVMVDGTTALRLWLTDLPEPGLPYSFITVVGYSDATAILVSYYDTRSTDLDNLLSQIHQSFQRGAETTAPVHDSHP